MHVLTFFRHLTPFLNLFLFLLFSFDFALSLNGLIVSSKDAFNIDVPLINLSVEGVVRLGRRGGGGIEEGVGEEE